jgi:hypothetical protein
MPYLCAPAPSQPNSSTSDKLQTCASMAGKMCKNRVRAGVEAGANPTLDGNDLALQDREIGLKSNRDGVLRRRRACAHTRRCSFC